MNVFSFTKKAKKVFLKLPLFEQKRILEKLRELKGHEDIFSVLVHMVHPSYATHRLRIGPYRLLLTLDNTSDRNEFLVVDVGHRREIYR